MESNPNKVNQYTDQDPRQSLFLAYYLDPKKKDTFSNAYKSAIKAGYAEEYAKTILSQDTDWLSESLKSSYLVNKAERNLDNLLDSEDEKVKADLTKFTLSRLNKEKYSERSELTGKDGKDLPTPIYGGKSTI